MKLIWRYDETIDRSNVTVHDSYHGWKLLGGKIVFGAGEFERFIYLNFSRDYCLKLAVCHS